MSDTVAVVLAAGKGTRMKSDLPKVLVPVCGRAMVHWVLDALESAGVTRKIVVVGYRAADVQSELATRNDITFVEQREQLGTGHAVQMCVGELEGHHGAVFVLAGDSPLTQPTSLRKLVDTYQSEHSACVLGTATCDDPTGLGRIVRDETGRFTGIVEEKDATEEQRSISEVNMSTYIFDCEDLLASLGQLRNNNKQGEYYVTDCPGILLAAGKQVLALPVLQACEALSINTVEQLAAVEAEMQRMGYTP